MSKEQEYRDKLELITFMGVEDYVDEEEALEDLYANYDPDYFSRTGLAVAAQVLRDIKESTYGQEVPLGRMVRDYIDIFAAERGIDLEEKE